MAFGGGVAAFDLMMGYLVRQSESEGRGVGARDRNRGPQLRNATERDWALRAPRRAPSVERATSSARRIALS